MKQTYITIITLLLTGLSLSALSACISEEDEVYGNVELKVGEKVPDFTVTMNDGRKVSTDDLKGNCSVIAFFHTGCPDCQRELPILQRLLDEKPYPISLICISRKEEAPSIENYWKTHGLSLPYSAQSDAKVFQLFAPAQIPRVYIADRELTIHAIFTDNPIAEYRDLLDVLSKMT